ncbi:uncharacterized protein CTRU02_212512 [Colletotrichum truncatum]|uniref:Uncharacterized protein n=1 Tax=Colletotrichum truncatum TaxID=5467 RepID=A0ACC3YNQ8_COLTU
MSFPASAFDVSHDAYDGYDWPAFDPTDAFQHATSLQSAQHATASPVVVDVEDAQTVSSCLSPSPSLCLTQASVSSDSLPLLQLADWDENGAYDEQPPTCIHYSIEWKLTANNRIVSKDSEPDLVLAPNAYWERTLRQKLDKLVRKKLPSNKSFRIDDTNVTVSVRDRSQRDLVKRFDDLDIDWRVVERQLKAWGNLFRAGKELRVQMSFNYVESGPPTAVQRGTKRAFSSVTQDRLHERAAQLDAEESSTGQPSIWRRVYALMRCPGPPCSLGPHCWIDDYGKKHYKLKSHHFRSLIRHVEQGGMLDSQSDMPEDIRDQLYAEEQQHAERQRKTSASSSSNLPPINITNVLPASSPVASTVGPATPAAVSSPVCCNVALALEIPGPRDVAVRKYCVWQCSQVESETLKKEFWKACKAALDCGLDLEQVHEDQNPNFFVEQGVKVGIAGQFVRDIGKWVEKFSGV